MFKMNQRALGHQEKRGEIYVSKHQIEGAYPGHAAKKTTLRIKALFTGDYTQQ